MLDFGKIVLSMKDERILEALVRFDVAKINSFDSAHLLELGLIAKFKPEEYDDVYYITEKGKLYLKFKEDMELEKRENFCREEERFQKENKREWIGILLSNVLSFMAVIISLIALLKSRSFFLLTFSEQIVQCAAIKSLLNGSHLRQGERPLAIHLVLHGTARNADIPCQPLLRIATLFEFN